LWWLKGTRVVIGFALFHLLRLPLSVRPRTHQRDEPSSLQLHASARRSFGAYQWVREVIRKLDVGHGRGGQYGEDETGSLNHDTSALDVVLPTQLTTSHWSQSSTFPPNMDHELITHTQTNAPSSVGEFPSGRTRHTEVSPVSLTQWVRKEHRTLVEKTIDAGHGCILRWGGREGRE
jgi:hypothetical protein